MQNEDKPRPLGKIAVIAVHGVGDPGPGSTAQSITDLLVRLRQGSGHSAYSPFTKVGLTIANREVDPSQSKGGGKQTARPELKQGFVSKLLGSTARIGVSHDPIEFIRSQLQSYKAVADDREYETMRHSGNRLLAGGECEVDVYEFYWADLIRIGSGIATFFTELYQLMFHLGHLATKTVSAYHNELKAKEQKPALWTAYETFVTLAAQYLSGVVFLFNVCLLPMMLLGSLLIGTQSLWQWLMAGLTLVLSAGLIICIFDTGKKTGPFQVGIVAGIVAIAALIATHAYPGTSYIWPALIAIFIYMAFFTLIIAGLVFQYDKSNPNSKMPGLLIGLLFWLVLVGYFLKHHIYPGPPPSFPSLPFDGVTWAVLESIVFLSVFGEVNFLMLLVLEIIAVALGALSVLLAPPSEKGRVLRVWGTAVFGLSLPTVLFILVTITAWYAYAKLIVPQFAKDKFAQDFSEKLLAIDSQGFAFTAGGVAIALALVIILLIPSIVAEFNFFARTDQASAQRLATWLNGAEVTLTVASGVLFVAAVAPLPFVLYYANYAEWSFGPLENHFSALFIISIAGTLGLTALAAKDDLGKWTLALGPILNKLLDVDSYLRQFPADATPKARIFNRYASLLRYLCKQDDVQKIVILSHSQGTVITADLLRFINDASVVRDTDLFELHGKERHFKKELHLFTMGCPLGQLYAERFPSWYNWAKTVDNPPNPSPLALPNDAAPIVHQFGLKSWSNAYGSGDYVGRALWRKLDDRNYATVPNESWDVTHVPALPSPASSVAAKPKECALEFCIGPFAHIQYWNEAGDSVARELDRLIATSNPNQAKGQPSPFSTEA